MLKRNDHAGFRWLLAVVGRSRKTRSDLHRTRSRGRWASSAIVPSIQAGSRRTSTTASSSSRSSPTRYTDLCGIVCAELAVRTRTEWRRTREPFDPLDLFHQPFRRPSPVTTFRSWPLERPQAAVALFAPPPVTCPETSRGPHPESDLSDDGSDRDRPERPRVHRAEALVAEQEHGAGGDAHRPEVGPADLGPVDVGFAERLDRRPSGHRPRSRRSGLRRQPRA